LIKTKFQPIFSEFRDKSRRSCRNSLPAQSLWLLQQLTVERVSYRIFATEPGLTTGDI